MFLRQLSFARSVFHNPMQRRHIFSSAALVGLASAALGSAATHFASNYFGQRRELRAKVAAELTSTLFFANAFQSRLYNLLSGRGTRTYRTAEPLQKEEFVFYTSYQIARFITWVHTVESGGSRAEEVKALLADEDFGSPLVLHRSLQLGIAAEISSPLLDFVSFIERCKKEGSFLYRLNDLVQKLIEELTKADKRPDWTLQLVRTQEVLVRIMDSVDPMYNIIPYKGRKSL